MKILGLAASALALVGNALATPTPAAQSAFNALVSNVNVHDAAIRSTLAAYRAKTVPLGLAETYIRGNSTAIKSLLTFSKITDPTPSSLLGLYGAPGTNYYAAADPVGLLGAEFSMYFQSLTFASQLAYADFQATLAGNPPADPYLPLQEIEAATAILLIEILLFNIFQVPPP